MFAIEYTGVEPDMMAIAKGIASGLPLGVAVARSGLMAWPPGSHASTFGGNPVSCRAALATLELLEGGYMENATRRGEQLRAGLLRLQREHPQVGDVRGLGLMMAMDVVKDRTSLTPDPAARDEVVQTAFRHGLLLLPCGETAVRFCPPLCVSAEQVEKALGILSAVLAGRQSEKICV